jgi:hypothetical protein
MKRQSYTCGVALAIMVLVGLARPAFAEGKHEKQVPFRGRLEGIVATVTPLTPPFVAVNLEGEGNATQLGHFDVSSSIVANEADGTAVGTYEFTAANGDTLTADYTEYFTPTDVPGVFSDVITATITGGTGRFAGATGSFDAERVVDMVHGTVTESFDGAISTPRRGNDADDDHND